MKDFVQLWKDGLTDGPATPLQFSFRALGERNCHAGAHWEFARIQVLVEPASAFEVIDAVPEGAELARYRFPDWAVFGLLDVFMLHEPAAPIRNVRITLEKAEYSPVDSYPIAFRNAGRDAGRKIVRFIQRVWGGEVKAEKGATIDLRTQNWVE